MTNALGVAIPALCAWRENRGGGRVGMQSILNVLANRASRDNKSMYSEATKRLQFSSLTSPGDSQLVLWPADGDPLMTIALEMTQSALDGQLPDITQGATLYYNPDGIDPTPQTFTKPTGEAVPFPKTWNLAKVKFSIEIAQHLFFHEV